MNQVIIDTAKDWSVNKALEWAESKPYIKPLIKPKLVGTILETQREYHEYVVKPQLEKQFGITDKNPKPLNMPYTMSSAYKNRYRGTKFGRRLAAKRALDFGSSPVLKKARQQAAKTSTNKSLGLGKPVGTSNCKTTIVAATSFTRNSNVLHTNYDSFLNISQGAGINQRSRRVINLRGVRAQVHFTYLPGSITNIEQIIFVNFAIIAPKEGIAGLSTTDFFRSYGSQRSQDFPTTTADTPVLINNPINTDKYEVMLHKQVRLASRSIGPFPLSEFNGNFYVPIKRQIRYDSDAASSANGDLRFCMWYTTINSNGTTGQLQSVDERVDLFTYFRDPDV